MQKILFGLVNTYCHQPKDTENEKWKSIGGLYGHFYISTSGRVWNALRGVIVKRHNSGYHYLCKHRRRDHSGVVQKKVFSVHILVATHFLRGYKQSKHDVVFLDGDHYNPQLYNLDFQSKALRAANLRPIKINEHAK